MIPSRTINPHASFRRRAILAFLCLCLLPLPAMAEEEAEGDGGGTWQGQTVAVGTSTAAAVSQPLRAGGPIGLGFSMGTRSGVDLKIWPVERHAFTIRFGAPTFDNAFAFSGGYQLGLKTWSVPGSSVSAQLGVAAQFRVRAMATAEGGYRDLGVVLGATCSIMFRGLPVELFVEVGPALTFAHARVPEPADAVAGVALDVEGLVGARFYPGRPAGVGSQ